MNKNMIKQIIIAAAIGCGLCIASCSEITPEIVEFDSSYSPKKPDAEDRSKIKVPPADLLTNFIYFKNSTQNINIILKEQADHSIAVENAENQIVELGMSKKLTSPAVFNISLMTKEEYPKTYPMVVRGTRTLFPEGACAFTREVEFKAGEQLKTIDISFDSEKLKTLDPALEYVLPLVAKASGGGEFKYHNYFLLVCRVEKQ